MWFDLDLVFSFVASSLFHVGWLVLIPGVLLFCVRRMVSAPKQRYVSGLASIAMVIVSLPVAFWLALPNHVHSSQRENGSLPVQQSKVAQSPGQLAIESANPVVNQAMAPTKTESDASGVRHAEIAPAIGKIAPWISVAYLVGFMVMVIRLVRMMFGVHLLHSRSDLLEDSEFKSCLQTLVRQYGLKKTPRLVVCSRIAIPLCSGILMPVILIPASMLTGLTTHEIHCVLSHELAHLRRRDPLVLLVQRILECILFFHPVIWWINRTICRDREFCCDQEVIEAGVNAIEYSKAICRVAELAQLSKAKPSPSLSLAVTGTSTNEMVQRVQQLLLPTASPTFSVDRIGMLVVVPLAILTAGMLALLVMQTPDPAPAEGRSPALVSAIQEEEVDQEKLKQQEAIDRRFSFDANEFGGDQERGLKKIQPLIEEAIASKASLHVIARLHYQAARLVRIIELNDEDVKRGKKKLDHKRTYQYLDKILDQPEKYLAEYQSALWYTNCSGLKTATLPDTGATLDQIEKLIREQMTIIDAAKLEKGERYKLVCMLRMDYTDACIGFEKWSEAAKWIEPMLDDPKRFLNSTAPYRLAMTTRQQIMFLWEAGEKKKSLELADRVCQVLEDAESIPEGSSISFQCMLRGKFFVHVDEADTEFFDICWKNYLKLAERAESHEGEFRAHALQGCMNMHRIAFTTDRFDEAQSLELVNKVIRLIESEPKIQSGRYSALGSLSDIIRSSRDLPKETRDAIDKAVEEFKKRIKQQKRASVQLFSFYISTIR